MDVSDLSEKESHAFRRHSLIIEIVLNSESARLKKGAHKDYCQARLSALSLWLVTYLSPVVSNITTASILRGLLELHLLSTGTRNYFEVNVPWGIALRVRRSRGWRKNLEELARRSTANEQHGNSAMAVILNSISSPTAHPWSASGCKRRNFVYSRGSIP